jgi:dTMP kinase
MTSAGKLIAIEGIDGSGKRTQLDLLEKVLAARDFSAYSTGFPQYDSFFGRMAGQFLNGEFGDLQSLDPRLTALLYAGDRFEAKPKLLNALEAGKIVLVDRYVGSNLAHQTARVPAAKRDEFIEWVEHLEYDIYDLPREDLILYLRVPPREAQSLVKKKSARSYTTAKQDLLEASLDHLQDATAIYDLLSRKPRWVTIECFDAARGEMRSPKEIAQQLLTSVEPLLRAAMARHPTHEGH